MQQNKQRYDVQNLANGLLCSGYGALLVSVFMFLGSGVAIAVDLSTNELFRMVQKGDLSSQLFWLSQGFLLMAYSVFIIVTTFRSSWRFCLLSLVFFLATMIWHMQGYSFKLGPFLHHFVKGCIFLPRSSKVLYPNKFRNSPER